MVETVGHLTFSLAPIFRFFCLKRFCIIQILTCSLTFKGDCSTKTGPDGSEFGADYTDHLAQSFETQTYVYEQASGKHRLISRLEYGSER